MSKVFTLVVVCLSLTLLLACNNVSSADNNIKSAATPPEVSPSPIPKPTVDPELLNASASTLCNRLTEIKVLPHKDPDEMDPIYEALVAKGEHAYPCLIEKITDKTLMPDPRQAPHVHDYAVGDTAVFVLVRIIKTVDEPRENELLQVMLPQPFRDEWKTNGIYAYFNYVSEPKNRKELQRWWKNWIKENKK